MSDLSKVNDRGLTQTCVGKKPQSVYQSVVKPKDSQSLNLTQTIFYPFTADYL